MSRCCVWDITVKAENVSEFDLITKFKTIAKKWVFQLEKGDDTGYLHFQGRISLHKKDVLTNVKKLFGDIKVHLSPTVKANAEKDPFYCMKEQTRVAGPWKNTDPERYIPVQYRGLSMRPFQQKIISNWNPDTKWRTINYIYCPDGGSGKTTAGMLGMLLMDYIYLPCIEKYEDILGMMYCECADITHNPKSVIVDMPRAMKKDQQHSIFAGLEMIKNGYLFEKRYRYRKWVIDSPNIWVFSNKLPANYDYLSPDRWKFWLINEDEDFEAFEPREE